MIRHLGRRGTQWSLTLVVTWRHLLSRGLHLLFLQHESKARIARCDATLANRPFLEIGMRRLAVHFTACYDDIVPLSGFRGLGATALCFLFFLRWSEPDAAFKEPLVLVLFATDIMNLHAIVLQLNNL